MHGTFRRRRREIQAISGNGYEKIMEMFPKEAAENRVQAIYQILRMI
jgi:hypothetical protein